MSSWQLVDDDDDGFRSVTAESSSERALPDEQPLVERSPLAGESSPWPQADQPLWPQPSSPHAAQLTEVFSNLSTRETAPSAASTPRSRESDIALMPLDAIQEIAEHMRRSPLEHHAPLPNWGPRAWNLPWPFGLSPRPAGISFPRLSMCWPCAGLLPHPFGLLPRLPPPPIQAPARLSATKAPAPATPTLSPATGSQAPANASSSSTQPLFPGGVVWDA